MFGRSATRSSSDSWSVLDRESNAFSSRAIMLLLPGWRRADRRYIERCGRGTRTLVLQTIFSRAKELSFLPRGHATRFRALQREPFDRPAIGIRIYVQPKGRRVESVIQRYWL